MAGCSLIYPGSTNLSLCIIDCLGYEQLGRGRGQSCIPPYLPMHIRIYVLFRVQNYGKIGMWVGVVFHTLGVLGTKYFQGEKKGKINVGSRLAYTHTCLYWEVRGDIHAYQLIIHLLTYAYQVLCIIQGRNVRMMGKLEGVILHFHYPPTYQHLGILGIMFYLG